MAGFYLLPEVRPGAHGELALLSLWQSMKGPITHLSLRETMRMDSLACRSPKEREAPGLEAAHPPYPTPSSLVFPVSPYIERVWG